MATVDLTKDNFEQVVAGNEVVIVDFRGNAAPAAIGGIASLVPQQ